MNRNGAGIAGDGDPAAAASSGPSGPPLQSPSPAVSIAGVRVDALDRGQAAEAILSAVARSSPTAVHLCNAYVLALASSDRRYASLLDRGDLNLADGASVARFARKAGLDVAKRPSGVELVEAVIQEGMATGLRHYFYGGDEATVKALAERLRSHFDGVVIVAADAPPFGPVTDEQLDELAVRLSAAAADIVWVGLGTPKQDDVVDRLRARFDGPAVPVGAAFDFIAGTKPRAPLFLRRLGLEWVHRLATEPRRLWKRYLWGNIRFLWARARTGRVLRRFDEGDA